MKATISPGFFAAVAMILGCTQGVSAPEPAAAPPAAVSAADRDWAEFESVRTAKRAGVEANAPKVDRYRWMADGMFKAVMSAGLKFYEAHPEDPRRWEAVMRMLIGFTAWDDGLAKETPEIVAAVDREKERAEWKGRLAELVAALEAAKDVPAAVRFQVAALPVVKGVAVAGRAGLKTDAPEWVALRAELDSLLVRFPQETSMSGYVSFYVSARFPDGSDPALKKAELQSLAGSANASVAKMAKAGLDFMELATRPLEISFTAVDGRSVDLKSLRGKVVLVDFWATWCGPCKAELPNVVAAYRKYHDKGFEVIGIALENAGLKTDDTVEAVAAKMEKAKKTLTDFTEGNDMLWPQYFDGKYGKNEIAIRYAVQGIPAMFLIDQEGKLVSTDARGPKLEREVKRLLKL